MLCKGKAFQKTKVCQGMLRNSGGPPQSTQPFPKPFWGSELSSGH